MTGRGRNYARDHARAKARNEASFEPLRVVLECGHEVAGHPPVLGADGRPRFFCPEGCGLRKARRK